jgi:hypothetical protein
MSKIKLPPSRLGTETHRRVFLSVLIGLCAMHFAACGGDGGLAPLPPGDGPLTGTWIQPGIDTWVQLDLSQSGSRVVGYYRTGSANFGGSLSDPIPVTGTAALPQATLQWTENGVRTMNATLSADGDSLTGTWSLSGQPATPFFRFQRATQ